MKNTTVSIAEGKKGFSSLIQNAAEKKEEIIVTKRGKPVAVIVPYDEYKRSQRVEGYRKIMEAREVLLNTGRSAVEIYSESRKELEAKP
jgi:prevent-host-death family protein